TEERVEIGDPDNLKFTNSFTIEAWVWVEQINADFCNIFWRGDVRLFYDPYVLSVLRNGTLRFHIEDNSGAGGVNLDAGQLPLRQWKHVAAVFDSTHGTM